MSPPLEKLVLEIVKATGAPPVETVARAASTAVNRNFAMGQVSGLRCQVLGEP
jgi:hypothetical protein